MRRTRLTLRPAHSARSAAPAIAAQDALVPAAYYTWQIRPDLWIGMSVNAPFGLSVKEPGAWAGGGYGAYWTNLKTYNAAPSIAYRINDWISIGAGVQVQYAQTTFGFAYNALGARHTGRSERRRLGLWLHCRRHVDTDPGPHCRAWLSVRHQPENQWLVDASSRRRRHPWIDQCDRQSAGHRYGQRSLPVCPAVDRVGYGRVVELEPDRHGRCVAAQWCTRDRWWQRL